jgi:hypothetical protein
MAKSIPNTAASVHQRLLGEMLANAPDMFGDVVTLIKMFLGSLVASLAERRTFKGSWIAPGPWR